jgi:hypothetical protein
MEKKSKKSTSKKTSKKTEINDDEILYGIECATIYFKQTNKIFLDCLNLIKKIHENPEYSDEDFDIIEERVNFPLSYSDELYDRLKHKYCNNLEDIYYSLLDGTLHEAWILGNELFKTDIVTNDKTKFNSHISKVISNGEYVEELIDFIDSVFAAYLLLDMYFRKAKGEFVYIPFVFDDGRGFHNLLAPQANINILNKQLNEMSNIDDKLLLLENELIRMNIYMAENGTKMAFETEEFAATRIGQINDYIQSCKIYLDIIKNTAGLKQTPIEIPQKSNTKLDGRHFRIASKRKTDVVKILSAMYDCRMFVDAEGKSITNKQELMEAFGEFFNDDLADYSTLLTQAKNKDHDTFFKPFDQINRAITKYYEGE